ncbi:beta-ribofuranosylaminobenzene 5'-phosphate synthase family protein [Actinacidiphila acidipaludis]|uniref:GHMP kinase N-terminal domain-containing protein n=1 Tax=Actinacidiphila acidipaludis TaxID=2873382 RepID=A0ABS7QAI3_9ACTN|nr:beta-ribofuranosylaminobenzene 5'-phosphate synthase family protein [Streptomyces acidipaludis]MBY8878987.1 hypothetical protein [Streptomyces acidipaludis]
MTILAPSRVHFGLLQLSRAHPTINMGLGAALSFPRWMLRASRAERHHLVFGDSSLGVTADVRFAAREFLTRIGRKTEVRGIRIDVLESVPSHVGLGSKTSLLCGIAAAVAELTASAASGGTWIGYRRHTLRGGASGIGINTAVRGGVVMDSGHQEGTDAPDFGSSRHRGGRTVPRIAARWELRGRPLLLALAEGVTGPSGDAEQAIFDAATPLPSREADRLASLVLYRLIPALATGSWDLLADGLNRMQELGLKAREWQAQPPRVHALRQALLDAGADCVVLSSMGPALLALSSDPLRLQQRLRHDRSVQLRLISVRNTGVRVWT